MARDVRALTIGIRYGFDPLILSLCALAIILLLACINPSLAQTAARTPDSPAVNTDMDAALAAQIGGPSSVPAQIQSNQEDRALPGPSLPELSLRKRLAHEYGLDLGADYQVLYQHASVSPDDNNAAGGVIRLYGQWTPFKRGSPDAGYLVFKVENRHRLGTDISPQALGSTLGYAGLTAATFSDAGSLLTNLYWSRKYADNRFAFAAGIVDVTDYVDVYGLVNPWTEFNNLAFSTSPTIPAPNPGLGAAVRLRFTPDNYYVLGGIADANGDPGDPGDAFHSFFDVGEYFRHLEFGWIADWEHRYSDNIHMTAWQVDDRKEANTEGGWGVAFSFSRMMSERWLPFVRAGYSDGGGALVDRTVSAGLGYRINDRNDYVGLGANWGRPATESAADNSRDQYTFEAYYRLQVLPQLQIVPSVQLILDPADNPSIDSLWVPSLRVRAVF